MIAGQGAIAKAGVQIVANFQSRHQRYEVMTVQDERTILFVDVVGSTEMYPRLGNVKAKELILTFLAELHEIVEAGKGELVKPPIGDELMCMFARPMDAALAACEMLRFTSGGRWRTISATWGGISGR